MSAKGDRQRWAILRFIADYVGRCGFAPTVREIGAGIGDLAYGGVDYHLQILAGQGRIAREPKKPRAMQLVLTPGIRVVRVVRCGACQQDMPEDHHCAPADLIRYGSLSDLEHPA